MMKKFFLLPIVLAFTLAGCQPAGRGGAVPFAWPLAALTEAEKQEIEACDIAGLRETRYANASSEEAIAKAYSPANACDWAVHAEAYLLALEDASAESEQARQAYLNAVQGNPGFALAILGFPSNYGVETLVQAPPFASEAVASLEIDYSWGGLGDFVEYHILINNTGPAPQVSVLEGDETLAARSDWALKPETVNAVGASLTDLFPVQSVGSFVPCTDNMPSWDVTITFSGGGQAHLSSNWNLFTFGGPWQAEIDGRLYIQDSVAIVKAIYDLVEELDLPIGQPGGMYCNRTDWIYDHITP